ncbi:hypothetical protein AWENTII_008762 [Aspergillus wentii]
MAGGYFDIPISTSRRSSFSDSTAGGVSRASPGPRLSPLPTPTEGFEPAGAQGRHRNAGILKSTNRVKFTVSEHGIEPGPPGSTSDARFSHHDRRGSSSLPQRPLPIASIPAVDKVADSQSLPLVDTAPGAPVDVTGLTIHSRASSPGVLVEDDFSLEKGRAIHFAQERAQRLASLLGRSSSSKSPRRSPRSSLPSSVASTPTEVALPSEDGDEIPMISLSEKQYYDDFSDDEDRSTDRRQSNRTSEAHQLVRQMARKDLNFLTRIRAPSPGLRSGQVTPLEERDPDNYVERPTHYRGGILSSLLKLYDQQPQPQPGQGQYPPRGRYAHSRQGSSGEFSARGLSPDPNWKPQLQKPRKWYEKSPSQSTTSLSGTPAKNSSSPIAMLKRSRSSGAMSGMSKRFGKPQLEDEIRITVHIAELLSRQRYVILLCRALMKFGAPTHRLEEYMKMTARVLEIDSQFLSYDPPQGVDLGSMADTHTIYKEVIHDVIGVEEAIQRLEDVMKEKNKHKIWFLIFMYGCASATVSPFAFEGRPIDMPIAFVLGCLVGTLQLVLSPRSNLYANVFEISAAVLTSFLARAFGSIRYNNERLFCFSTLAQSSIALILPGYTVLCASLELQSRSIVAGSVRIVYAIIYSLFLGFGITIGTAVYGLLDSDASAEYTCAASPIHNEYLQRFPFVILFTVCLAVVNQAKWKQLPMMIFISFAGYVVNYFSSKRFASNTQISNAMGAFVIGVIGNLYSRLRHGIAAAAMLPAIFVLVPSGLAASGSLISGITSAEEITKNSSSYSVISNGTQGFMDAAKGISQQQSSQNQFHGVVFDIGYGMIQVAIGFTIEEHIPQMIDSLSEV